MKIGIFVGKFPPPVFVNQLVCGLVEAGHKVFLYGSSHNKNFRYNNPLLFVRIKPKNDYFVSPQENLLLELRQILGNDKVCVDIDL